MSPQSLNRFSYVINSPINLTDPSGHCYIGGYSVWIPDGQGGACSDKWPTNNSGSSGNGGGGNSGSSGNNDVPLSKNAQGLINFSDSMGMTPEEVIGIGLGHEMFFQSKEEQAIHMQAFRNGFLRYTDKNCNGNPTYNCMLNYFSGSYESVYNQFLDDGVYTTFWETAADYIFDQATGNLGDGNQAAIISGKGFMNDFMNTISLYSYDPVNNIADRDLPLNSGVVDALTLNQALGYPTSEMGFLIVKNVICPSTGKAGYSLVYNWYGEKAIDKAGAPLC
jgi:hypothetical protein